MPPRRFALGTAVIVPTHIHDGGLAYIVGYEPGPHAKKHSATWTYFIRFPGDGLGSGEWWQATEEELIAWQQ